RELATERPVAVITQTTLSLDDVAPIVDALEDHLGTLRRPHADDICYATQNRQDAVKAMVSQGATLVLVIGSETSSNAQRLVEVAQGAGAQATLVDGESELDPKLLDGHETIGLTAGASTRASPTSTPRARSHLCACRSGRRASSRTSSSCSSASCPGACAHASGCSRSSSARVPSRCRSPTGRFASASGSGSSSSRSTRSTVRTGRSHSSGRSTVRTAMLVLNRSEVEELLDLDALLDALAAAHAELS